ncbi:hypothetical protein [Methylophilus sp. Leaf414]|jgi:hypothetical protein|uniref:hypothetical protein n=1 Tax=Methylophilus sp. Leaf414 TaxID=1736371 RepID=UPI0006FD7A0E|nr:hypothetical protein [Methylophilus sp. Leaf414]KQT36266.1 prolyl-tRNA synthetase [Methylophilus sp. Leaf414]
MQLNKKLLSGLALLCLSLTSQAEILPEAEVGIKIPLSKKPTTRPMTVAYLPGNQHYYIADGGLAPMGSEFEAPISKSEVHAYTANGQYVNSAKPGFDNRSLYYNANSNKLETITYNISTAAGFSPNTGIFSLDVDDKGEVLTSSNELYQFNPAFGDAGTMPSYDPATNHYYAKQEHGNLVFVVDAKQREKLKEIKLDYSKAQVVYDDVSDHFIAFTGVAGNELALLDVDHKAVLIFDLNGQYVGKSALPKTMKLRSHNHFNGAGYSNGMLFVYHENEGEFGTYYGFKVVK